MLSSKELYKCYQLRSYINICYQLRSYINVCYKELYKCLLSIKELYKCLLSIKELYKSLLLFTELCDCVTESSVHSSGDACDTGDTVAAVPSVEEERTDKEACLQNEHHHSGSGPASDIVCAPAEEAGCSAEIKACDGKGDGQESVGEFGKLNIEFSESGNGL